MLKSVIAATALLAIAGSSFHVYAQQGIPAVTAVSVTAVVSVSNIVIVRSAADISASSPTHASQPSRQVWRLTPDQTKNWPPFEQAVRDMAQMRIANMKARQNADQQAPSSPFDRLARRADNMSKRSDAPRRKLPTPARRFTRASTTIRKVSVS